MEPVRQFPYKLVRCEHCGPNDVTCDWCLGSKREINRIEEDGKGLMWLWVAAIAALTVLALWGAK